MFYLVIAAAAQVVPVITTREPRPASPWVQSVQASCGQNVVIVSGYGVGRPLDQPVRILVNGRPVTGRDVQRLRNDLSKDSAVYRLQFLCSSSGGITMRIAEGFTDSNGTIRYRSGAAVIRGNTLSRYLEMEDADAKAFWFR